MQEDRRQRQPTRPRSINVAVLKLPAISNFTDLEVLEKEKDVIINYLSSPSTLSKDYDCVILPGTKNVMEDTRWLSMTGWKKAIGQFANSGKKIFGICGGYQILGKKIKDPFSVESNRKEVKGLDLLPLITSLEEHKIVRKVTGISLINNRKITGYEIHMGITGVINKIGEPFLRIHEEGEKTSWQDGWSIDSGRITGTYVHGILDTPGFREVFLNGLRKEKGLMPRKSCKTGRRKDKEYDRLADHFEKNCDVERIIQIVTKRV